MKYAVREVQVAETVYIKAAQSIRVEHAAVTVGELGSIWCSNPEILSGCRALPYTTMKGRRSVESILDVIETIQRAYPDVNVESLGETDFILEHILPKNKVPWLEWIKVAAVCLIIFLGAAFSIITFNEDVSVQRVFSDLHQLMTGQERQGFTWLEAGYSAGLFFGILIFYNHFQRKTRRSDPTPLEVEMRTYERDINQTILDQKSREQERQKRLKEEGQPVQKEKSKTKRKKTVMKRAKGAGE